MKGFDIFDVVGKDVCVFFQDEIDKFYFFVKVVVFVNDIVGIFMVCFYFFLGKIGIVLGVIFGIGINGVYVEKFFNLKKFFFGEYDKIIGEMVINIEWGLFDNQFSVFFNIVWDVVFDKVSFNFGIQMYEKCVLGMFLGEILCLVIIDFLKDFKVFFFKDENFSFNDWKLIINIVLELSIYIQWGFDMVIMLVVVVDNIFEFLIFCGEFEKQLGIYFVGLDDVQVFKVIVNVIGCCFVCFFVVVIVVIVLQIGKFMDFVNVDEFIDIGVDGSLVEYYFYFRDMIYEVLCVIDGIGEEGVKCICIGIVKDGFGVGVVLIVFVVVGMEKRLIMVDYFGELCFNVKSNNFIVVLEDDVVQDQRLKKQLDFL